MKKYSCFAASFIFLFCVAGHTQTNLPSELQSWNEVQFILPLVRGKDRNGKAIDKLTATFNGIVRVGRNDRDLLDNRAGVAIDYRIHRYVTLMTTVLYRRDELAENVKRYETRLDFGVTLSKTIKNFTFHVRNVFEHRFRNSRGDINVYRNRFQVSYPIRRNDKELFTPLISNEGYYDLTQNNWSLNEFFAGISRKVNRRTTVDIAYIRGDSRPSNVNELSLTLKIKLR